MTSSDNSMDKMMAEAERLGKEQEALEERNKKRRAKGRPPLPDLQEKKDMDVGRRRYRTGDATTVDAADAMKLFEMRKAEMMAESGDDDIDDDDLEAQAPVPAKKHVRKTGAQSTDDAEKAIREAEAARRVQDMKNGRVDHVGTWSPEGAKVEGGDSTVVVDKSEIGRIWGDKADGPKKEAQKEKDEAKGTFREAFGFLLEDLYKRLGTSFEAIERSLSDLQGRVSEIVTASAPKANVGEGVDESEFQELLARKSPVVFDVGGTQMTFDAVTVFHAPPCITVVSKIGSAKITPKPGAQLLLTYEMDGQSYVNDPVTFLGTRFDLPMFGLSFVGFIRDNESDMIDTAAGIESAEGGAD